MEAVMSKNDYKCAGSGTVCAGEYGNINTAGSCRINGDITCDELKIAGSCHSEGRIICSGYINTAGSFHAEKCVESETIKTAGSAHFANDVKATEFKAAGSVHIAGNLIADTIRTAGSTAITGNCEGEDIEIFNPHIGGTVNGENVTIKICITDARAGSIVGGKIVVENNAEVVKHIFSKMTKIKNALLTVDSIEADEVELECTNANKVTCKTAVIGAGCKIELLEYSENADVSDESDVRELRKI